MNMPGAESQTAFCAACNHMHSLPREPAVAPAQRLMERMHRELKTDYLYGEALGKMFGVLLCKTVNGNEKILKAFSGQYNGRWTIDGWAPPLFDVEAFNALNIPMEKEIKLLSKKLERGDLTENKRLEIQEKRKGLSRQLMKDIHTLYQLHNFRKQQCALADLFPKGRGIPTGTGDCCAPKLLNYAALNDLHPIGLTEFYWGKTNRSKTRHEGHFYPACEDKCQPILGFLLCGIE